MENKIFKNRLRDLRRENNVSGKKLAEFLGVKKSTISNWENGVNFPNKDRITELADYFHVSVDYLLGRSNDKFSDTPNLKNNNYSIPDSIETVDQAVEFLKSLNLYAYGGLDLRQKSDTDLITLARTILSTLQIQGKL